MRIRRGPSRCGLGPSRWAVWLAGVVAAVGFAPDAAAQTDGSKLVVVIYPDESDGAPGTILVNRALRSTFAGEAPWRVDVRNEYVSTSRSSDSDFMQAQVSLLRWKYAGRKVDLVVAGLSSGLDFTLRYREELFPGVPVVFVAVDHREVQARHLPPDVIGVPIRMDLDGTLDLALRLHPDARRVFVVAGNSPFDRKWADEARRVFRPREGRLEFVSLTGLPMDDLLARVAALPEQSLIYYLHIYQDGFGRQYVPAEALELLAAQANAPVYGHVDTYVGRGAVGGRVFTFEAEGESAARLGLRVLAGGRTESIGPAGESRNTDLFDWRQLRRWGIGADHLPPDSVVRYREPTFWDEYKWHVSGGVALCVAQGLLITGLCVQLVKRRRAEERFRRVVETAPAGMLLVDRDGTVVMANAQVERLFGYAREELLGRPVDLLLPEHEWERHRAERAGFFADPEVRPAGSGRELLGRRKDGTEFPMEVGLGPLRTPRGLFALASVTDLTARRRAEDELLASRRELQALTGRLLEAQEAERRRIARELHDDFNQNLALLSVELEVLARQPPADSPAAELRRLAARVKELSSSVHALSHQLHPSKLEHLGLVAAVGGLCREVTLHHGLEVRFTNSGVADVSPGAALCLYRIVQEALRNVVKHGRTDHAAVELRDGPDGLRLQVCDHGRGFDPASACGRGGLGLVSMRERLNLVGGEMTIESRPGGGTRIDVHVPAPPTPVRDGGPERAPDGILEYTP